MKSDVGEYTLCLSYSIRVSDRRVVEMALHWLMFRSLCCFHIFVLLSDLRTVFMSSVVFRSSRSPRVQRTAVFPSNFYSLPTSSCQ